jgi:hypothetical protein
MILEYLEDSIESYIQKQPEDKRYEVITEIAVQMLEAL